MFNSKLDVPPRPFTTRHNFKGFTNPISIFFEGLNPKTSSIFAKIPFDVLI